MILKQIWSVSVEKLRFIEKMNFELRQDWRECQLFMIIILQAVYTLSKLGLEIMFKKV